MSRDDQLAAHRVPPQLIGVVPANAGGFGNVIEAPRVFSRNEIQPVQAALAKGTNDVAGDEVCRFLPYMIPAVDQPAPAALR